MSHWNHHLVRVGLIGQIGRFDAADATVYPRGADVLCRTSRGLEVGEVLAHAASEAACPMDGALVRRLTVEDRLLIARLEKNRDDAFAACERLLAEHRVEATLVDVEQLFDGESIYFYFLGDPPTEAETLLAKLTAAYEAKAQIREFAAAIATGCGPDCGTEAATGCGSGGCQSCAIASACSATPH